MSTKTTSTLCRYHQATLDWIDKMTVVPALNWSPDYLTELTCIVHEALQDKLSHGYRKLNLDARIWAFEKNLNEWEVTPEMRQQIKKITRLATAYICNRVETRRHRLEQLIKKEMTLTYSWLFDRTKCAPYPGFSKTVLPKETAGKWIDSLDESMEIMMNPEKSFKDYREKMFPLCWQIIKDQHGPHWGLLFYMGLIEKLAMKRYNKYIVSFFTVITTTEKEKAKEGKVAQSILGKRKEAAPMSPTGFFA